MASLLKIMKGTITDENNDLDGLLAIIIFSCILGSIFTAHDIFSKGNDFDFEKFGNGIAYILGAGGVGYGAKRLGEKHDHSHKGGGDDDDSGSATDVSKA